MAHSSSGSSDEFYDAPDEFKSDNDDHAPVWASFSQPKFSQILIPPPIPRPPPRTDVPFLPAPPTIGTPRLRPARSSNQSKDAEERKSSIGTRGELFQKYFSNSPNGGEDTPTKRRRKLDELRSRLRSFEIGDEEKETKPNADGEKCTPSSDASSTSDLSSLASWSKNFLNYVHNNGGNIEQTVVADDSTTISTASRIDSNDTPRISAETALVKNSIQRPESAAAASSQHPTSSSSSSNASSKSSTLDKTSQPISNASINLCSVSHRRPSSARSSKSNSLTKDVTGIAACEHYLYSNDDHDFETLARKNSEAAEVIEALTSELVRKAEIEREHLQKSSASIAETSLIEAESDSTVFEGPAETAAASAISPATRGVIEEQLRRRSLRNGSGVIREPDIVASNRVKLAGSGVENAAEQVPNPSAPTKPPRSRRSTDAKISSPNVSSNSDQQNAASTSMPAISLPETVNKEDSDKNDLSSVMIKNLDTGEKLPLAAYDEKSQQHPCINPLALHIMQLTAGDENAGSDCADTDSESMISSEDVGSLRGASLRDNLNFAKQKTLRYKKALEKKVGRAMHKTVNKMKQVKEEVAQHWHKDDNSSQSDEEDNSESNKVIRVRASHHHKGPYHFDQIKLAQDLSGEHTGSVWSIKFSHCGRVMATAGQDKDIRVWVLKESFNYFNDMRQKYSVADTEKFNSAFMSPMSEDPTCHLLSHSSSFSSARKPELDEIKKSHSSADLSTNGHQADLISLCSAMTSLTIASTSTQHEDALAPFVPKPFCIFKGHSADVLDLCWSKNYFLLSSSMDRTVRLWHISRKECLCCFQHAEFVTAIAFLPKDDRYFLSVSLDGKLRVWHIPEKKVALWNEVDGGKLITALTFARNGKFVVVGTTDGRCVFYTTDRLKYHTQIDVKSSHGKNSRGHKVTGLDSFQDKLLVTSSDSRIRLYDTRDLSLTCKYKGYYNYGSQIRASFSHDGKYIVCGSEDKNVYLWKTVVDTDMLSLSVRKDRNRRWESIRAHNAVVTAAVFAPRPDLIYKQIEERKHKLSTVDHNTVNELRLPGIRAMAAMAGEVLVTADFGGTIYVFFNKPKVKLGSSVFLPSY